MPLCVRLYLFFQRRPLALAAACLFAILFCGLLASRLAVREDISALLPTRPEGLARQFALLREAPLVQGLSIAVSGEDPAALAAQLAERLRSPEIPEVITGLDAAFSPSLLLSLCAASPNLMDERALAALPAFLEESAIRSALQKDRRLLLTPQGLVLRDLVAMDPLGICLRTLRGMAPRAFSGLSLEGGSLRGADKRFALLLAEPALSMSDSANARAVMGKVREAASGLPGGSELIIAGGHRHTEENADIIENDVQRVLPLSLGLLFLAFALFIRNLRGLAIVLLPTASLAVATAFTGAVFTSLSGIVLGFGSVILGITADYAIHVYYALRAGGPVPESLTRVGGPLLLGAATTLSAFLTFFLSSIPCVRQMSVLAASGIMTAVCLALVVLPHLLKPGAKAAPPDPAPCLRPRSVPLGCLSLALALALAWLFITLPINGDIRALSYMSEAIKEDEARLKTLFGGLRNQGMFVVEGQTLEQALEKNDLLWAELEGTGHNDGWNRAAVTGLAPLLPSRNTQEARQNAWLAFWEDHETATLTALEPLAEENGFRREAFESFGNWMRRKPALISTESLAEAGLTLPLKLIRHTAHTHLLYSLVEGETPPTAVLEALERAGSPYISGQTFRAAMDEATRTDLRRFGGLSLLAVLGMSAFGLRSFPRLGMALLPVAAGLFGVLSLFRLMGVSLNIFHAMALPLVMSLSVDYGIFILAHLEGRLDSHSRKGVLLSGLTTLSGFGVLALAKHPALFSIGITVTTGLTAALFTALCILPLLAEPKTAHVHKGRAHA